MNLPENQVKDRNYISRKNVGFVEVNTVINQLIPG